MAFVISKKSFKTPKKNFNIIKEPEARDIS